MPTNYKKGWIFFEFPSRIYQKSALFIFNCMNFLIAMWKPPPFHTSLYKLWIEILWNFKVVKWYPCYLLELPKPIKDNRLQSSTEKQTFKPTSRKLSCQNKFLIVLFQRYYQYWTDVCQNTFEISIYIIKVLSNYSCYLSP